MLNILHKTVRGLLRSYAKFLFRTDRCPKLRLHGFDIPREIGPGLSWVDDILDTEGFGRPERRRVKSKLFLKLRFLCFRIV